MKKVFFLLAIIAVLINPLTGDTADIPNGSILENKKVNGQTILRRKHDQKLTIDYAAQEFQMVIYDSPFNSNIIDTLKKKDQIQINEIIIIDSTEFWLNITYKDKNGYILYERSNERAVYDYYEGGQWQPVDLIKIGNMTWHTLKCDDSFFVYTNLNIRDKTGLTGTKIGLITATQSNYVIVKTIEITKEEETIDGKKERWAKIQYGKLTGWVFAGYLEYERGGPRFSTPESRFEMGLGEGA